MTNEQIKADYKHFLETGCDYTDEMRARDKADAARFEMLSLACLFAAGVMAGFAVFSMWSV